MLENKLFEALLDVIPFKAYAVDVETYEVVYANKLMRENMYAPQEQYCWEKVFGQEQICSWCTINQLKLRETRTDQEKLVCEFFDETDDRWIKSYDELMSWPDGRDVKYSILVDISDQKEIQGDMIKSHAKLAMHSKHLKNTNKNLQITKLQLQKTVGALEKEKNKALSATESKSKFLAHMSHEIRTPINAVLGMSQLLSQTNLNDQQQDYVHKIELSSKNLFNIINNILDFSKIEAGKVELEHIHFYLDDVLDHIKNTLEFRAVEKGLKFNIINHLQNNLFYGDSLRLGQILINLVANAIKFTSEGEITVTIHNGSNDRVIFEIKDTGIGLSKEEIKKLFNSFSQADNSTTRQYGGTGLGLVISNQLCHLMDGEILVESQKGVGSSFVVDIYLPKGDKQKVIIINEDETKQLQQQLRLYNHCKILLVEDNKINQEIITSFIQPYGIDMDIANNGLEALELYSKNLNKYNLILMDIQMPIMDGYQTTSKIRETNRDIPVIAISANTKQELLDSEEHSQMNAYISKPIDVNALYKTLIEFLPTHLPIDDELQNKAEQCTLIPHCKHINTQKGLERFTNNSTLYLKILCSFYEDYYGINQEDFNEVEIKELFHILKGLSGNIAATQLFALLQNPTESLKNVDAVFAELNNVCNELHELDYSALNETTIQQKISPSEKNKLFNELKVAVESKRPKKCSPILEALSQCQFSSEENNHFIQIKQAIESFEYDKAKELLN